MFNFFSHSSSNKRYPNPNRGGAYYQRKGLFGKFGSYSNSGSSKKRNYYNSNEYQVQIPYPNNQNITSHSNTSPVTGQSSPHSLICPKCKASIPEGSKFCLSCGAAVTTSQFCSNCGKPLPAQAKFCPECGTPR